MPPLEDWLNIVSVCLGATCLEAPVKINIAKTTGYGVAIGEFSLPCWGETAIFPRNTLPFRQRTVDADSPASRNCVAC